MTRSAHRDEAGPTYTLRHRLRRGLGGRERAGVATFRPTVLYGVGTLAVLSVVGAGISVAGDLSPTWLDAMGPTGRLSIPWPMMLFQLVMAVLAGSTRRPLALIGSGAVALALAAGVVSGFFDGGYDDGRMSAFERGYQLFFIASLVAVAAMAARRFLQALRAARSGVS